MARPVNTEAQRAMALCGCDRRTYEKWTHSARIAGKVIPWLSGPAAVRVWMNENGRKVPQWLLDAEIAAGPPSPAEIDPEDISDPVATLDRLLADCGKRIATARAQKAAPNILAAMGRDFAKLVEARAKVSAARRQEDDGLVPLADVTRIVDEIHAAIPDRIEQSLLKSDADARAALDAGTWRQFCERFRNHALADLSRSFAESLNTKTE